MSEQQNGSQEGGSEPGEPETLDFLKDELEAAGTEHFSFGKDTNKSDNEPTNSNRQGDELEAVADTNVVHEQIATIEEKKVEESAEKQTEQNGVVSKEATSSVEIDASTKDTAVDTKVGITTNECQSAQQQTLKGEAPEKRSIVETATKTTDPAISPERPPKKPDLHDLIEGSKVPIQAATEQRPPKSSEPVTKSARMKTQPSPKEPALSKADDLRQLAKTNFQRKRETYTRLKEWDERRAQQLAIHRAVVDDLQASIDRAVKSSLQNLQIYTSFLREKSKQQLVINTDWKSMQHTQPQTPATQLSPTRQVAAYTSTVPYC